MVIQSKLDFILNKLNTFNINIYSWIFLNIL